MIKSFEIGVLCWLVVIVMELFEIKKLLKNLVEKVGEDKRGVK